MNLAKLFDMQRELDNHIEREHPRQEGEDRLLKKILALQVEIAELANELPEVFKFWSHKKNNREKALKEYVDCLHFLLSIGLESEIGTFAGDELMPIKMGTIEIQFITLFKVTVTFLEDINYYPDMWELFLGLGEMLGFTWDEIEAAYMKKNAINHARQVQKY